MKSKHFYTFLVISTLLVSITHQAYSSIKQIPNEKVGFSQISLLQGNSRPLYYIDINNDKITDIIATCSNGSGETVCYYLFDKDQGKYILSEEVKGLSLSESTIENLVANDLNQDGFMDLIITIKDKKSSSIRTEFFIWNEGNSMFESKYVINDTQSNLFIGDLGDKRGLNIMFVKDGKRQVLAFEGGNPQVFDFSTLISSNLNICNASAHHATLNFASPHSSGMVDIDGDCLNDLMIMSTEGSKRFLEIWIGVIENNAIRYCLTSANVYELEENLGLFSIADIDRDAMPDIVFPVLNSSPPQIVVAYNKKPIAYNWTANFCEEHKPQIMSGSNVSIKPIFDTIRIGSNTVYIQTITLMTDSSFTFYNTNPLYPVFLRFSDINQDSYPDFTIVLYNKSSEAKTAYVFLSQPILYDSSYTGPSRRSFSHIDSYSFPIISNALVSTFIDFEETGKMDVIVLSGSIENIQVTGFYNHNGYDSYTMKSTLLSELNCFYSLEYGATFRFITTNINGSRRMDLSIQQPQPGTMNGLSSPYGYLGIGRSNNYIENFIIVSGNYIDINDNQKLYTPVIPNSQLVIFHSLNDGSKPLIGTPTLTQWKVDLIVKPTQKLNLMIAVIIIMITIMTTIAVKLQIKERDEDSRENKETFAPWFG